MVGFVVVVVVVDKTGFLDAAAFVVVDDVFAVVVAEDFVVVFVGM